MVAVCCWCYDHGDGGGCANCGKASTPTCTECARLSEAIDRLRTELLAEAAACEERKGIPQFQRDGKHHAILTRLANELARINQRNAPRDEQTP